MKIAEFPLTQGILQKLIGMYAGWEMENSCHDYCTNRRSDIKPNRIFLAIEEMGLDFWSTRLFKKA